MSIGGSQALGIGFVRRYKISDRVWSPRVRMAHSQPRERLSALWLTVRGRASALPGSIPWSTNLRTVRHPSAWSQKMVNSTFEWSCTSWSRSPPIPPEKPKPILIHTLRLGRATRGSRPGIEYSFVSRCGRQARYLGRPCLYRSQGPQHRIHTDHSQRNPSFRQCHGQRPGLRSGRLATARGVGASAIDRARNTPG